MSYSKIDQIQWSSQHTPHVQLPLGHMYHWTNFQPQFRPRSKAAWHWQDKIPGHRRRLNSPDDTLKHPMLTTWGGTAGEARLRHWARRHSERLAVRIVTPTKSQTTPAPSECMHFSIKSSLVVCAMRLSFITIMSIIFRNIKLCIGEKAAERTNCRLSGIPKRVLSP